MHHQLSHVIAFWNMSIQFCDVIYLHLMLKTNTFSFLQVSSGSTAVHESSAALSNVTISLSSSFTKGLLRTYSYAEEEAFRSNPLVSKTQAQWVKEHDQHKGYDMAAGDARSIFEYRRISWMNPTSKNKTRISKQPCTILFTLNICLRQCRHSWTSWELRNVQ